MLAESRVRRGTVELNWKNGLVLADTGPHRADQF